MRRVLRWLLLGGASGIAVFVAWLLFVWPPPFWWRSHWPRETAFQAMRQQQERAAGDTSSRRYRPVPLDSISDWIGKAAVAGEDDAFYQHHGIDWHSLRDALGYRRGEFSWSNARDRSELRRALGDRRLRKGPAPENPFTKTGLMPRRNV